MPEPMRGSISLGFPGDEFIYPEFDGWLTLLGAGLFEADSNALAPYGRMQIETVIELGSAAAVAVSWEQNFGEYGVLTHITDFGRNHFDDDDPHIAA